MTRKVVSLPVIDHRAPVGVGPWLPGVPETRDECKAIYRDNYVPCPYIACRHHLHLTASSDMPGRRAPGRRQPASEIVVREGPSCALDLADKANNAGVIADVLGLTRRRIEQIQRRALEKLKARGVDLEGLLTNADSE